MVGRRWVKWYFIHDDEDALHDHNVNALLTERILFTVFTRHAVNAVMISWVT